MRVTFERSGGFAGLRLSTTIDTSELEKDEAAQLEQEIQLAGFFNLPGNIQGPAGGADRFVYHISVAKGLRKHSVDVGESALSDSLRPLVEHLEQILRTRH